MLSFSSRAAAIAFKQPGDSKLQGTATIEAGGAGVRIDRRFSFGSGFVELRPFGFEKLEMDAHRLSSYPNSLPLGC